MTDQEVTPKAVKAEVTPKATKAVKAEVNTDVIAALVRSVDAVTFCATNTDVSKVLSGLTYTPAKSEDADVLVDLDYDIAVSESMKQGAHIITDKIVEYVGCQLLYLREGFYLYKKD